MRFSTKRRKLRLQRCVNKELTPKIGQALDDFGVDYIELTSPAASEQSRLDCEAICKLGLKSKILTHIRCHMDVRAR